MTEELQVQSLDMVLIFANKFFYGIHLIDLIYWVWIRWDENAARAHLVFSSLFTLFSK